MDKKKRRKKKEKQPKGQGKSNSRPKTRSLVFISLIMSKEFNYKRILYDWSTTTKLNVFF